MASLSLTKHHGLGNDFLIGLDLDGAWDLDAETARRLCDRRAGIGADGIMRVTPGRDGADVHMELRNADGSEAEVSGNGVRCLGQAVVRAEVVSAAEPFTVSSSTGSRRLQLVETDDPMATTIQLAVDMGQVTITDPPVDHGHLPDGVRRPTVSAHADIGNPHLVLLNDGITPLASLDLDELGPPYQAQFPETGGVNVEWITIRSDADIDLVVYERGVGITLACGTGAAAAAYVAHAWGLVGDRVMVHMPGGAAVVRLGPTVTLVGPSTHVADFDIDPDDIVVAELPTWDGDASTDDGPDEVDEAEVSA